MKNWILAFQPHTTEWPMIRRTGTFRNFLVSHDDLKSGDIAYFLAGSSGISGWGRVKAVKSSVDGEGRILIELHLDRVQENLVSQTELAEDPLLLPMKSRIIENFSELKRAEFNRLNAILRVKGFDAPEDLPEFDDRIGKFGFKDTNSLRDRIESASIRFENVSLMFLDLDNFKSVNDEHNHSVGDEVIRATLTEIDRLMGTEGQVFHRSGDEIIILLPNTDLKNALSAAETIRVALEGYQYPTIGSGCVTATIGVASFPETCQDFEKLETAADDALGRTKKKQKNSVGT